MVLTILSVAYPLATVGPDAVGGAEQVLSQLDQALVQAGHHSLVIACEGSQAAGTLLPAGFVPNQLTDEVRAAAHARYRECIAQAIRRWQVDLVHLHGIDFHEYLPPPGVKTLVTLHLPPTWYPPEIFKLPRPLTYLHCVSAAQHQACPPSTKLLPAIENGVLVPEVPLLHAKRRFAFALGRICPEKGYHHALDAARQAKIPFVLAGQVYGYETHQRYFAEEIAPRLDASRRFIGPVGPVRKLRLLAAARCLLVPSLAPETSSLVAMESMACGTPVIAFPSGALAHIVEHGKTGFLVQSAGEMADAIQAVNRLDPKVCVETARRRFSLQRMTGEYLQLYERLTAEASS